MKKPQDFQESAKKSAQSAGKNLLMKKLQALPESARLCEIRGKSVLKKLKEYK
jgi:hypothetical protein